MAEVDVVDRLLDTRSGTFGVRLKLPNPDLAIPGGQKCRLRFQRDIGSLRYPLAAGSATGDDSMKGRQRRSSSQRVTGRRWRLEALEPRILFSANLPFAGELFEGSAATVPIVGSATIAEPAVRATEHPTALVVVDPSARDFEDLARRLVTLEGPGWRGYVLDTVTPGLSQLSTILASHQNVGALHVLTSAEDGRIRWAPPLSARWKCSRPLIR